MPLASIANNQIVEIEAINFPACGLALKNGQIEWGMSNKANSI